MTRGGWFIAVPERVFSPRRRCSASLLERLLRSKTTNLTSPSVFPLSSGGVMACVAVTEDSIPSRTSGGAFELHREAIHKIC
jgi:hypothetical protein